MKQIFIFLLLFCSFYFGYSQPRFQITGKHTSTIVTRYSKTANAYPDTIHIHLRLSGKYDAADASRNRLILELQQFNLPNNLSIIGYKPDDFPQSVWPGNRGLAGEVLDTTLIVSLLSNNLTDTLKSDEIAHIVIKDQPAEFHSIRLTNATGIDTKYLPNKPFWVEVGANFDLVDGLEPNNFFSGIFFHKRDIRPVFSKVSKNLGLFAGIFESKTLTNVNETNFSTRNYYDSTSFLENSKDSLQVFKGIGTYTTKKVVKNVSLFFSPQVRLTNGSANEDGLHLFTSLWVELQWQKLVEEKIYAHIRNQDTFHVHINELSNYNAQSSKKEFDIRSHYLGIGFPIFFRETFEGDNVHMFINPVFGFSSQPTKQYLSELEVAGAKDLTPERKWSPFYIVQFRLNEEKYGVSVTGEVRGLLKKDNPPFVTLALTKKFDLIKFIEFNK
jgi:hypothetical protein